MNLLFLCTGNSCRSQIAEGWARKLSAGNPEMHIQSAGIEAHGKNPRAIAVMKEAGIDISKQESSKLTAEMLRKTDYIVTVCGHADENCPVLPEHTRKEHWPLEDPAKVTGSEADIMQVFRSSRDDIQNRVEDLLQRLKKGQAHEHI